MRDADFDGPPIRSASAPGKVILLGEHAVVYGEAALAVPVTAVAAVADVHAAKGASDLTSDFPAEEARAPAVASLQALRTPEGVHAALESEAERAPAHLARGREAESIPDRSAQDGTRALIAVIAAALVSASIERMPAWSIRARSSVPTGRGMGSSAAIAVAVARAIRSAADCPADSRAEADAALHGERVTHGTPSGIDTSVISLGRPIRFTRQQGAAPLTVGAPFSLVVADSGAPGRTRDMVAGVRERRAGQPAAFDRWIARIGELANEAEAAIATGDLASLGRLMDENHAVLQSLGVSTLAIEELVIAARRAGALGAKLSGAGGGGVVIALAPDDTAGRRIETALRRAGAPRVYGTTISSDRGGT